MTPASKILSPLIHLFYPHVCAGCASDILEAPNLLCLHCIDQLPHTGYANLSGNPVEKIFWGRIHINAAMSEFYFSKGNIVQSLIHELKYKGNKDIGVMLGNMIGNSLLNNDRFLDIEALIPLPLFAEKEFKRGYNQSEVLCQGIREATNIPIINGNVIRKRPTETQTKKRRSQRWENVEGSFLIKDPKKLEDKHVLLVDDVITTGSTLEACGSIIMQVPHVSLSIASLAYASL